MKPEATRKIYLSGPMTGYPEHNYPLFHEVSKRLRAAGHEVYSPAEYECEDQNNFPLGDAMVEYANQIMRWADTIVMLSGWEKSTGALAEYQLARNARLTVIYLEVNPFTNPAGEPDLKLWERHKYDENLTPSPKHFNHDKKPVLRVT